MLQFEAPFLVCHLDLFTDHVVFAGPTEARLVALPIRCPAFVAARELPPFTVGLTGASGGAATSTTANNNNNNSSSSNSTTTTGSDALGSVGSSATHVSSPPVLRVQAVRAAGGGDAVTVVAHEGPLTLPPSVAASSSSTTSSTSSAADVAATAPPTPSASASHSNHTTTHTTGASTVLPLRLAMHSIVPSVMAAPALQAALLAHATDPPLAAATTFFDEVRPRGWGWVETKKEQPCKSGFLFFAYRWVCG